MPKLKLDNLIDHINSLPVQDQINWHNKIKEVVSSNVLKEQQLLAEAADKMQGAYDQIIGTGADI